MLCLPYLLRAVVFQGRFIRSSPVVVRGFEVLRGIRVGRRHEKETSGVRGLRDAPFVAAYVYVAAFSVRRRAEDCPPYLLRAVVFQGRFIPSSTSASCRWSPAIVVDQGPGFAHKE